MRALIGFVAFVGLLAAPRVARAQDRTGDDETTTSAIGGGDTEALGGAPHMTHWESPQRFALEIRFGPWRPQIDQDFPQARPFQAAFGDDHRVYVGVEFDWQVLRIPKFGSFGPGFGWGYTHFTGTANITGTNTPSAEDTTLGIMPMYAVGVLRVDVLARETAIPLVGYAKAGLGYAIWWAGNDLGSSRFNGELGRGHTWGTQFAIGGMLLLDAFDNSSAQQLDNEVGINNTYVFFEWMNANLDNFGTNDKSTLRVGTSTWVLGLAMEM